MQRDIFLVLLFAGMVFLFLSNFNLFGIVGSYCKMFMFSALGAAAYILPVVIFALTLYGMMGGDDDETAGLRIGCVVIVYVLLAIVCDLMSGQVDGQSALDLSGIMSRCRESSSGGGLVGGLLAWLLMHTVGMVGTVFLLIIVTVICLVFITGKPLLRLMQDQAVDARDRARYRREAEAAYREEHPDEYDDGFLPEEADDALTDDDIAEYRARQARLARKEREERLRNEARRDVERRHETRNQMVRTFRGIVGDTDLSKDPYVRQMRDEAAARAAAQEGQLSEDVHDEPSVEAMPETADDRMAMQAESEAQDRAASETTSASDPFMENAPAAHQQDAADDAGASPAAEPAAEDDRNEHHGAAHRAMDWWRSHTSGRDQETESTGEAEDAGVAASPAAETAVGAMAAAQLMRNQRPGTDGIQLAVVSSERNEYQDEESLPGSEEARASVRQSIPIHRESNNLHEINALEFQGSYAALARDTIQTDEDDEDLTSRIIREGMAELGRQDDVPASDYAGGAHNAAAAAFSKSNAFTEIQDAYGRGGIQAAETNAAGDTIGTAGEQIEDSLETSDVVAAADVSSMDQDAVTAAHDDVSLTEPDAVSTDTASPVTLIEGTGADVAPGNDVAAADDVITDVPQPGVMREMTTPAGSGSALAARHAQNAQIHTESKAAETTPAAVQEPAQQEPVRQHRAYVYPPLNLLSAGNPSRDSGSDEELRHTAEVLETTLHTFGVNCKITDISQGPAVTRYELLPEQGVKVSKVVGLSDDIKLALAAMDIRIEAPIPGKSAIGIEVPNKVTSMVALRDILANPNFRDHKSKLAIGIGKDISGQIVVSDLAKMPHVLIAGATGSGKSVCINTIIMSILYHATPEEVKLLMIDPKVVELSVYNGIPHLLYPVVTNPQQAATLLNWAVAEMEARYRKFADARVRDMKGYNQMIQQQLDQGRTTDEEGNTLRVMPRIVVIVDELADLMMVAKNDVETAICRLAQLARAAGIHLIIATQRPSVDVITGLIKANMPSRIAFAVSSGVDSRTILDMNGAEKLLGKGDMLFFPQGLPKPARIQGAFVDDDEVSAVVEFIREQNPADTEEEREMRQQMDNLASGGQVGSTDSKAQDSGSDIDDYFYRAGKFIIEKDNASIGLLQRGFRIGFNRAARLMDQLCDAGVVAESEGTKSRRILMTEGEFEAYCQENDLR